MIAEYDVDSNWSLGHGPVAGEDVVFTDRVTIIDGETISIIVPTNCDGMHAPSGGGDFNSVTVTSTFDATITLAGGFTTGGLSLASGAIDQPAPTSPWDDTDITVTSDFTWTGGTLNSTANLANLTITGSSATALVAPEGGGTVNLGDNITLEEGAAGTIGGGTIALNKDVSLITSTGSSLYFNPGALGETILGVYHFLHGEILPGTSWTVAAHKAYEYHGEITNQGTFTILPDSYFTISGVALSDIAYTQGGATSATYLHGSSYLLTGDGKRVLIGGGNAGHRLLIHAGTGTAHIWTDTLEVDGGDIYVNYGTGHTNFDELLVDGNIWWRGGTFHPYVYAGGAADVWRATNPGGNSGNFDIDGGTIAPIYLDSDYGPSSFPHSGDWWQVLKADTGFVDNDAPSLDDTFLWSLQIDPGTPKKYWKLVAN